jgi:DNA repair exonuclease SbcCD ATPase subunit
MACKAWACQAIVKAVDKEWVSEKHDEDIGYQAVEPLELLELLRNAGGDLDDLEITDLNTKMLEPWDGVESPVMMFARADKYERQLERHSIPKQPELRLSYAVLTYQTSGQFDTAMGEWHAKLLTDKTFPNFRVYIQNEYTKMVKRNRLTAGAVGKGIANKATEEKFSDAEAQAMVIAEVANVLQAQNTEQMKNMMAMFEKLLASAQAPAVPVVAAPPKTPRQPRKECPHCGKKHANHEKCWELDANKALRPANWKSTKTVA